MGVVGGERGVGVNGKGVEYGGCELKKGIFDGDEKNEIKFDDWELVSSVDVVMLVNGSSCGNI
jgi:hypothetical protein